MKDGLRAAALEALGALADARAKDAIVHGDLSVAEAVTGWEGSAGRVVAHRVTLALDAARLGALRAAPAVVDALAAALSRVVADEPGQSMHSLVLGWSRAGALQDAGEAHGYRGGPPAGPETAATALHAYLDAARYERLAALVQGAEVTLDDAGGAASIALRAGQAASAVDRRRLVAAARDLFGIESVSVRE